jgi:small GTP-binding protein
MFKRLMSRAYDRQVKLLLIGHSGAGKTSLLLRWIDKAFSPTFITTIGIDFKVKMIRENDKVYKTVWWDTAGQERFRSLTASYLRGAQGILLVADVMDPDSWSSAARWIEDVRRECIRGIPIVLVANKVDCQWVVDRKMVEDFAAKHRVDWFETSALTG